MRSSGLLSKCSPGLHGTLSEFLWIAELKLYQDLTLEDPLNMMLEGSEIPGGALHSARLGGRPLAQANGPELVRMFRSIRQGANSNPKTSKM